MTRGSYHIPKLWLAIWTTLVVIFVMAPMVVVILVSLTPTRHISLPTDGVSFQWYTKIPEYPDFIKAGVNSMKLALQAAASALFVGVLAALAIVRYNFRLRTAVNLLVTSPLFIPMVMSGLAILLFFSAQGWRNQESRMYIAHLGITVPYVIRTVTASLTGFDMNQELAAHNLGAHPLKAFWYVTLPQIGPGVIAGALFAFIVSFDNVGISIFLTGSQFTTLPVELYSYASYNSDPLAASISVLMILFSVLAIGVVERLFGVEKLLQV